MAVKASPTAFRGARRYARALLLIAKEQNRVQELKQELGQLKNFFEKDPELFSQLLSPGLGKAEREKILEQLIQLFGLSLETGNLLRLLNRKGRLDYLLRICEAYSLLSEEAMGIQRVEVFSAHPLKEEDQQRLIRALEKRTGKSIRAEFRIDPGLIGGIKVQIGSLLLDGSVKTQLELMRENLTKGIIS